MFQIDRSTNRLRKLERPNFSEVGVRERDHLQEWLASMPEALCEAMGEDEGGLLIIQKEFDGFQDTRERLDLLALDKNGQLVVIENKLDDSGRDVVWQALKYAAYCSQLNKENIIEIFQRYLDRHGDGRNASEAICEFLEVDTLSDVAVNEDNNQRIVFIAAKFRKEVTSTVLWLCGHKIDARCIKVVPYKFSGELLVDIQQVIPPPEAADYMVRMAEKATEEKSMKGAQRKSHQIRLAFWAQALEQLSSRGSQRFQKVSASKDHWISCGTGIGGCAMALVLAQTEIRAEFVMQRSDAEQNKWLFDQLLAMREEIEGSANMSLNWDRKENVKRCFIRTSLPIDTSNEENWPEMIRWACETYEAIESAVVPHLNSLNVRLQAGEAST
ncbi:DUF4268 domain-containing protein [Roseovarius sp. LXJ103]|uniref:DUF4268 domain-containing protein n=1 Tax=Roseovarius carneus TaxID=2853164 RepID=UPI0015E7FA5B|nr:DUF4268 domain-containing protein [Roseovarius carneus]MBZ8117381.1 DUF4268 domain-containing protein [Roseovarius carneus]